MLHALPGSLGARLIVRCKGSNMHGTQCKITNAMGDLENDVASPLRMGRSSA